MNQTYFDRLPTGQVFRLPGRAELYCKTGADVAVRCTPWAVMEASPVLVDALDQVVPENKQFRRVGAGGGGDGWELGSSGRVGKGAAQTALAVVGLAIAAVILALVALRVGGGDQPGSAPTGEASSCYDESLASFRSLYGEPSASEKRGIRDTCDALAGKSSEEILDRLGR